MQHTEIIKREDGSMIRISISLELCPEPCFKAFVYHAYVKDGEVWWNAMNEPHLATPAEIHAAKIKCWEKLKP